MANNTVRAKISPTPNTIAYAPNISINVTFNQNYLLFSM